jgi:alpha-tubulin suppressor-like RCC1 family protein
MHAITTDGKLYAWGYNANGQLGMNNTTQYSSPIQVGALTTWKKIAPCHPDVSYHTLGTTTDGKLYAWGYNGLGQLGQGNTTQRNSPVQVGALTTWSEPSAGSHNNGNGSSAAVKTDGTLWTWGQNDVSQLGLGNTTNYSSPVQVGTASLWSTVSMGYKYALAIYQG